MTHKLCTKCWRSRPLFAFHKNAAMGDGLQNYCIDCHSIVKAIGRELTKKQVAEWSRTYNYGMARGTYDRMVQNQNGLCAICKKRKKLVVDHDHATGAVRALLCQGCNVRVGFVEHELRAATDDYIRLHRSSNQQEFNQ